MEGERNGAREAAYEAVKRVSRSTFGVSGGRADHMRVEWCFNETS